MGVSREPRETAARRTPKDAKRQVELRTDSVIGQAAAGNNVAPGPRALEQVIGKGIGT